MNSLDQLYQQLILEHSKERHGSPLAAHPPAEGVSSRFSRQYNPLCGDDVKLRVDLRADTIEGVFWDGQGCSISMASASVLSDLVAGMMISEVRELVGQFRTLLHSRGQATPDEAVLGEAAAFAGVSRYVARIKCAMLAWVGLEVGLEESLP